MSLDIDSTAADNITIVHMTGRLTLGEELRHFRNTIRDLLARNQKNLILDLSGLLYVDSSGLGEMVSAFTTVTSHGGQLVLASVQEGPKKLLEVTKLQSVFPVFETVDQANRELAKQSV